MKKSGKIEKLIVILLGMFLLCTTAFAAPQETDIRVKVDGKLIAMDQLPVIESGTTLVPVRPIFEALGFEIHWETQVAQDNRQMSASRYKEKETLRFYIQIDNNKMVVDYVDYYDKEPRYVLISKSFEVPPQVINGNTLIPVRAISEALGCKVDWLENEKMIVIDTTNAKVVPVDNSPQPGDIRKAEIKAAEIALEKEKENSKVIEPTIVEKAEKPVPDPNVVIYSDNNKPVVGDTPGHILKDPNGSGVGNFTEKYRAGSIGQCTWYADGRFYEVHNIDMASIFLGSQEEYILNATKFDEIQGIADKTDVRSLSMAVYEPSAYSKSGHVVFVEYVEKDVNGNPIYVYITEANGANTLRKGEYDPEYDGLVQKIAYEEFIANESLLGYIIPSK